MPGSKATRSTAPSDQKRRRLIRAASAVFVAFVGSVVALFGNIHDPQHRISVMAPSIVGAGLILAAGTAAVGIAAGAVREGTASKIGDSKGSALARTVGIVGFITVALWTGSALGIQIQALLLGGAVTGVVIGIAAQQTLGNVIAGTVLLVVKPFTVGQETVIKSSLGEYEGYVSNIGFFYVTMVTESGQVDLPNAVALASAVGPGARAPKDEAPAEPEDPAAPESVQPE